MATIIAKAEELYFDGKQFVTKHSKLKKVRAVVTVLLLSLGVLVTASIRYTSTDPVTTQAAETTQPVTESKLLSYVKTKAADEDHAEQIANAVATWSEKFNVDPKLLVAIIKVESNYNPFAISHAGAMGLMQVIPRWHLDKIIAARETTGTPEVFNINTNIYLGAWVISNCMKQYKHVVSNALKCYNGSIGMQTDYHTKVLTEYSNVQTFIKREAL